MGPRRKQDGADTYDSPPNRLAHYAPFYVPEPYRDNFQIYSATIDYAFSTVEAKSTTSYLHRTMKQFEDVSEQFYLLLSPPFISVPSFQSHTARQITNETRLSSTGSSPFQWIVGTFYMDYKNTYRADIHIDEYIPLFGTNDLVTYNAPQRIKSFAAFGEFSYNITDNFKLLAGLRWFNYRQVFDIKNSSGLFLPAAPYDVQHVKARGNQFTPKLSAQYTFSPNSMIYATYAKGARVAGTNYNIPISGPGSCAASLANIGLIQVPESYDGDTVDSYELGLKSSVADRRVTINGSGFWVDWANIQQQLRLKCGYSYTTKLGSARSRGATIEAEARITDALTLSLSASYTDAKVRKTIPGVVVAGERIQNVPRWTSSQHIEYKQPLTTKMSLVFSASNQYYGDSSDVIGPKASYDIAGLRGGLSFPNIEVDLFIDNVTDEKAQLFNTLSQGANIPSQLRVATNRPRTFGIDIRTHY
jgi:outer membrane receptor protein involved in Fe transport